MEKNTGSLFMSHGVKRGGVNLVVQIQWIRVSSVWEFLNSWLCWVIPLSHWLYDPVCYRSEEKAKLRGAHHEGTLNSIFTNTYILYMYYNIGWYCFYIFVLSISNLKVVFEGQHSLFYFLDMNCQHDCDWVNHFLWFDQMSLSAAWSSLLLLLVFISPVW